jgi:hypothetical protein
VLAAPERRAASGAGARTKLPLGRPSCRGLAVTAHTRLRRRHRLRRSGTYLRCACAIPVGGAVLIPLFVLVLIVFGKGQLGLELQLGLLRCTLLALLEP